MKELLQKEDVDVDDGDGDGNDGSDLCKVTWKGHCWSTPFFPFLVMVVLVIRDDENAMLVLGVQAAVDVVAAAMASFESGAKEEEEEGVDDDEKEEQVKVKVKVKEMEDNDGDGDGDGDGC